MKTILLLSAQSSRTIPAKAGMTVGGRRPPLPYRIATFLPAPSSALSSLARRIT